MGAAFPHANGKMVVLAHQLIKYNRSAGEAQPKNARGAYTPVRMHTDPSWLTLNVALNAIDEYSGGGVGIPAISNGTLRFAQGRGAAKATFVANCCTGRACFVTSRIRQSLLR